MFDKYYTLFYSLKFKEFLLEKWYRRDVLIDSFITAFITLMSAACVAVWSIWQQLPWLWSILILTAQCLQLIRPQLPYGRRITAFQYMIPDMRSLNAEAEIIWFETNLSNGDFSTAYFKLRREYEKLESRYISTFILPHSGRLEKKAQSDTESYIRYTLKGGEAYENPEKIT